MAGRISGLAVGVAALGGVLVYAGFRGVNPIQALRDVGGGSPPAVESAPADLAAESVGTVAGGSLAAAGAISGVAAAAAKYKGDRYSIPKRQQPGWSDCSSFCDKILVDVGIPPPVKWAASANYRASGEWKTIPASQAKAGDVAVSSHHIVMVTGAGGSSAIGQQNPRVNVRSGSVASLMGSQKYVYKTYVGNRRKTK